MTSKSRGALRSLPTPPQHAPGPVAVLQVVPDFMFYVRRHKLLRRLLMEVLQQLCQAQGADSVVPLRAFERAMSQPQFCHLALYALVRESSRCGVLLPIRGMHSYAWQLLLQLQSHCFSVTCLLAYRRLACNCFLKCASTAVLRG